MFTELNRKLIEAKDDRRKKAKYEEHLQRLHARLQKETEKKDKLKYRLEKEKEDVARLEGFSLTNLLYTLTGRKLEKIDQEQQDVLTAKLNYKDATEMIADIEQEIQELSEKHDLVADAEIKYAEIVRQKEELIHDSHSIWSEKLSDLAEREAEVSSYLREYEEAIDAGEVAIRSLAEALDSLDSAKGWSTFDMFGGGLISTAIKHSNLDDAEKHIHQAQNHLRRFQEELEDVENHFHINIEIGSGLTLADYFLDGFLVDWIVHGRIADCHDQTELTRENVSKLVHQLWEQKNSLNTELERIHQQRMEVLESTN